MNPCRRTASSRHCRRSLLELGVLAGALSVFVHPLAVRGQVAAPTSGLMNSRAIVYSSTVHKVYAVDTGQGAVEVYAAGQSQPTRVKVGAEPVSIAVNTATGKAYVANAGDGTVSVLDGSSDAVVATLHVGGRLYTIAADPVSGKIFVTHTFGNTVSMIDGATGQISELKTGSADLIAINPRTGTVYLLGYGGSVVEVKEATGKFISHSVGRHAWALTIDETSGAVYVTRIEDSDLAALKPGRSALAIFPAGSIPCAIAVNTKAGLLYVANNGNNTVTAINTKTAAVEATIPVGDHPKAIAFDPDRQLVFVANTLGNSVTVIDAKTNKAIATLPAGNSPCAIAVIPGSNKLYVANESDGPASTVVDLSSIPG